MSEATVAGEQGDPAGAGSDVAAMDYEQARDELADVVRRLETGGLSLDESVALWERGELLARHCEQQLAGARERVDEVLRRADGETPAGEDPGDQPEGST